MRDYIKTKTIEEAKRQIESGFATKEQIEQWTADPPILPSWKVVEMELSDVPEFLDNNGIIYHDCKLKWRDEGDTLTDETGEKFRFRIPLEVEQEVRAEVERRHRTAYDTEVKAKADKMRADLLNRLNDSPDIEQGRRIAIERLERILEGRDTEGLTPAETNLRTAWQDIAIGSPYMGGLYDSNKRKRFSLAAVTYASKVVLGLEADFMQIDNPLRRVYTEARATQITLQWLRDTPPQGRKASTGAEIEAKLTQRQAAYLLAYQNAKVHDPASDNSGIAKLKAKELCGLESGTSGVQLYRAFKRIDDADKRRRVFKSTLDEFTDDHRKIRKVTRLLEDIKTIIPRLKGTAKEDAENDLNNWNTMYLREVK